LINGRKEHYYQLLHPYRYKKSYKKIKHRRPPSNKKKEKGKKKKPKPEESRYHMPIHTCTEPIQVMYLYCCTVMGLALRPGHMYMYPYQYM
jgi:hypothetical protein